ncbi:DUF3310 domain-containing protein [Staphylococcus equorum]|uniref:DUF3310 domain-containing protein n=1 Tax=Staphylococcus equorum TaxID=246432 RepID=UPI002407775F|nr:DUF3310 domain-containing protein [Staphylococcus equorum]MDG0843139.1 DUF3310 domain-containing protein [Staphylococcus equorum]
MKITELRLNELIVVHDVGFSELSDGMPVIGRVNEVVIDNIIVDKNDEATIISMGNEYVITNRNEFERYEVKETSPMDRINKTLAHGKECVERARLNSSNDVQQRKRSAPSHYEGDIDFLDYFFMQSTPDERRGAMKFTMGRYSTRLGRKDDEISELKKIADYANRYIEVLENERS